jgi:O-antigen ligase
MDTPEMVRNTSASFKPNVRSIPVGDVVLFAVFFLVGSLVVLSPFLAFGCLAAVAALAFGWLAIMYFRHAALEVWQVLLLIAMTGYTLLNYGFENLTIQVGVPIIISYVMMFASLAVAAFSRPHLMMRAWKEPAMLCLLALLLLTLLHLVVDIPSYGIWAFRDASMFFDGIFLTLGLLWAIMGKSTMPLMKWLMVVFLFNLVYSLSLPWGEKISAWSPKSGVFLHVPLLGNYRGNGLLLLLGAIFYMFLARYVVKWPRWMVLFLAMAQLFGLAIYQARALYVAFAAVLIIFVFLGETGKSAKLLFMLLPALAGVLVLTTLGIEVTGRIGIVSLDFLKEHVRGISGAEDTPGSHGRGDWFEQAFRHFREHPVVGEGFGMVLIDFTDWDHAENAAVRQPHNSNLSVLARLGTIGFVPWVAFHLYVLRRFLYAFRQRRYCEKRLADLIVWLFMVYVIYMISASVEAQFEFPSGSIPFYFFVGLALGLIRYQIPQKRRGQLHQAALVPGLAGV